MELIEAGNPQLKGVLPKVYARQNLDATVLGELIDLIGNIALGDVKARSADVLSHVFEYFLGIRTGRRQTGRSVLYAKIHRKPAG